MKGRAGRPSNGRWDANRNRRGRDYGTDELRLKKALAARGADPSQTNDPLQLAGARGLYTEDQVRAGYWFATLRAKCFGRADLSIKIYERFVRSPARSEDAIAVDPERELKDEEARRWYGTLLAEIDRECGRSARDALTNIVVYNRWPAWLLNDMKTRREIRQYHRLGDVLTVCMAVRQAYLTTRGTV
jgi:hypothetical protein